HFTVAYQILYGTRHVFDGDLRVDPMLIEEIEGIDLEALERGVGNALDLLGAAIWTNKARTSIRLQLKAKLGGDRHFAAEGRKAFAEEFFVGVRTIDFGGVEESDTAIDGGVEEGDHFLLVLRRTVRKTHSHAAQAEGRDFQAAFSKFALLHCRSVFSAGVFSAGGEVPLSVKIEHSLLSFGPLAYFDELLARFSGVKKDSLTHWEMGADSRGRLSPQTFRMRSQGKRVAARTTTSGLSGKVTLCTVLVEFREK